MVMRMTAIHTLTVRCIDLSALTIPRHDVGSVS